MYLDQGRLHRDTSPPQTPSILFNVPTCQPPLSSFLSLPVFSLLSSFSPASLPSSTDPADVNTHARSGSPPSQTCRDRVRRDWTDAGSKREGEKEVARGYANAVFHSRIMIGGFAGRLQKARARYTMNLEDSM